jgi:hypothetical protein
MTLLQVKISLYQSFFLGPSAYYACAPARLEIEILESKSVVKLLHSGRDSGALELWPYV